MEAVFTGDFGHTYAFYSVAIDAVGNREAPPTAPDAITTLIEPPTVDVIDVRVTNVPTTVISLEFSAAMAVQAMINDGSILSAVSLVDLNRGPAALSASQWTYQDATHTLTLALGTSLPEGYYDLRLDGSQLRSTDGWPLRGGRSGIVFPLATFEAAQNVQSVGGDLQVNAYSAPASADWNADGLTDLIVGEQTATGEGKVRVYLNQGSNEAPVFGAPMFAQTAAGDLAVPASGYLGASPRMVDWDGDGLGDLLVGQADGRVGLWTNVGTGADPIFDGPTYLEFGEAGSKVEIHAGSGATLEVVDWDNDGRQDLLVGGMDGRIRLYLNQASFGAPDFLAEAIIQEGGSDLVVAGGGAGVAVADLDGDGRKDLVVGDTEGRLRFYPNTGTDSAPSFDGWQAVEAGAGEIDLPGSARSQPFVVDFNADGILDLLLGANDGLVRLYPGLTLGGPTELPELVLGTAGGLFIHTFEVHSPTNLPPSVGTLTASPTRIVRSEPLTLTAGDVHDPDGTVMQVEFYRGETLLGTDDDGQDGWSLTIDTTVWALGEYTFYARAHDDSGAWSDKTSLTTRVYAALQTLDFGVVPVFGSRERTWTLHNDGTENLVIQAADIDLPFAIRAAGDAGNNGDWIVVPGATTTFVVSYRPTEDGLHQAALTAIGQADRRLSQLIGRAYSGHQNLLNRFDVNDDGSVTPQDALLLINEINRGNGGPLSPRTAEQPGLPWFVDVTNSGTLVPNDVLAVINQINKSGTENEPSGEAAEGAATGHHGPSGNYGWVAMANTAAVPTITSATTLPVAAATQNDLRVNWLTAAVENLVYRTTHRQPDLRPELAAWQRQGADTWQSDDSDLIDWQTLLGDPATDLVDLDACFAALG